MARAFPRPVTLRGPTPIALNMGVGELRCTVTVTSWALTEIWNCPAGTPARARNTAPGEAALIQCLGPGPGRPVGLRDGAAPDRQRPAAV